MMRENFYLRVKMHLCVLDVKNYGTKRKQFEPRRYLQTTGCGSRPEILLVRSGSESDPN